MGCIDLFCIAILSNPQRFMAAHEIWSIALRPNFRFHFAEDERLKGSGWTATLGGAQVPAAVDCCKVSTGLAMG
jgi:hypothetical protein